MKRAVFLPFTALMFLFNAGAQDNSTLPRDIEINVSADDPAIMAGYWKAAIADHPDDYDSYIKLAFAYVDLQDLQNALDTFGKATQSSPMIRRRTNMPELPAILWPSRKKRSLFWKRPLSWAIRTRFCITPWGPAIFLPSSMLKLYRSLKKLLLWALTM